MNKYRVVMKDQFEGKEFSFAVYYKASSANNAGLFAIKDWDNLPIVTITRHTDGVRI